LDSLDPSPLAAPAPALAAAGEPRSRRALLGATLGAVAAALGVRLGLPDRAEAAAGSPAILGASNSAGTKATTIAASVASNGALLARNASTSGYGVYGQATATTGATRGVYGRSSSASGVGVYGYQGGAAHGTGSAVRADGVHNTGVRASTSDGSSFAVHGTTGVLGGVAGMFRATAGTGNGSNGGVAVRALSGGADGDEIHRPFRNDPQAAGEFAGQIGLIAAPTRPEVAGPAFRAGILAFGDGDATAGTFINETGPGIFVNSNGGGAYALMAASSGGTGIVASGLDFAGDFLGALRATSISSGPVGLAETGLGDPPATGGTLYVSNIGGGKRALFVRFPTGSPIQLAIEP
jgi:hypothetical protein